MKNLIILGSTGSIGKQALEVVETTKIAKIFGLSCHQNIDLLEKQIKQFAPKMVVVTEKKAYEKLRHHYVGETEILYGKSGIKTLLREKMDNALVLNALVGIAGFLPSVYAIEAKKDLALANKESLVVGGQILIPLAKEKNVQIIPVDSEHSAIYQCLMGNDIKDVQKIILTASGGPFRTWEESAFKTISIDDALAHPTYAMGEKISIDSSTLMNKALEVMEAHFLFSVAMEKIEVIVHPESIIHSMVEYVDGTVMAQMGEPDMKLPIQLALGLPKRINNAFTSLDLTGKSLHFEAPRKVFTALFLGRQAMEKGGLYPTVLNGANEKAVHYFLRGDISYMDIVAGVKEAMENFEDVFDDRSVQDIMVVDTWAREYVKGYVREKRK